MIIIFIQSKSTRDNVDKVTQATAGSAEESASAAEGLNAQAQQMKAFVADLVTVIGGNNVYSGEGAIRASRGLRRF